jgi:hypothetical protein
MQRKILQISQGILWLTFSKRGVKGGHAMVLKSVDEWLQQAAVFFGYYLKRHYYRAYGTVVTMIYVTGKEA